MSEVVEKEVITILRQIAELPDSFEVAAEHSLSSDLNIDSLKMIDLVLQVEAALDIELGDEFARDLVTVADFQNFVNDRVSA